jgi:ornithine cyclodeaminase/alanine dehydrogenase-like protein (mu-crystallin family)
MSLPHIHAELLRSLVPMGDAITALRTAFAGPQRHAHRVQIPTDDGADLLVMPATYRSWAGVKSIVVQPRNSGTSQPVIGGSYVLLNTDAATAVATVDGAALTSLRTPAVSAIAIDALSSPESVRNVVIIGRGPQAAVHAEAIQIVRPGSAITLLGRERGAAERAALAEADVVVTATSSPTPVLELGDVRADSLIVAIGAYRPDRAELAPGLVSAAMVWVDELGAAKVEAGDLIQAAQSGWDWSAVVGDLHDLATGPAAETGGLRVFKSVGLAVQDLVVASLAYERLSTQD